MQQSLDLSLYNQKILTLAGNILHIGHLSAPQAKAQAVSRLCGSKISVELCLDAAGCVSAYAQQLEACALGQAAASVMARHIMGSHAQELHQLAQTMRAMLTQNGAPPTGKWTDLDVLLPVRDYKNRHASTLLVFDAVEMCLQQLGR